MPKWAKGSGMKENCILVRLTVGTHVYIVPITSKYGVWFSPLPQMDNPKEVLFDTDPNDLRRTLEGCVNEKRIDFYLPILKWLEANQQKSETNERMAA
jgi:hypothetical protein